MLFSFASVVPLSGSVRRLRARRLGVGRSFRLIGGARVSIRWPIKMDDLSGSCK